MESSSSTRRSPSLPEDPPIPMPRATAPDARGPDRKATAGERERSEADGVAARLDPTVRRLGRRVLAAAPFLAGPLHVCRSRYADAYVRSTRVSFNRAHVAPIEPYRVMWVDPAHVRRVSAPTGRSRFRRAGAVVDGDWDRGDVRFRDTDVFHAFRRRFVDGDPWSATAFYDRIVSLIRSGEAPWGCDSEAAFRERCRRLDALHDSLREHGFLSQRDLAAEPSVDDPVDRWRPTLSARVLNDEIAVDVGRDGELLFADGRNRLALAKVLGVEEIPVIVLRRHAQWVTRRDAAVAYAERGRQLPDRLRDHPDVPAA